MDARLIEDVFDKEIDYNYATAINGVKVSYTSSTREGCLGSNIINNDNRTLWVSKKSVPQKITLNLTNFLLANSSIPKITLKK